MKTKKIVVNKFMNLVQNKAKVAELYLSGDIVDIEFWEEDVTPTKILDALEEMEDVKTIDMFINSYGGSTVAGNAIIALLDTYRSKNNVKINAYISTAMSMASGIAMVADKVYIHSNGLFMVHKPLSSTYGNADDMKKTAEILDIVEQGLIANYMRHFKGTEEELSNLLEAESWLTAQQALDYGFVDEIIEPMEMVASAKGITVNNVLFERKEFVDKLQEKINAESEVKKKMKYDNSLLENYGISEESFGLIENIADLMTLVNAQVQERIDNAVAETKKEFEDKESALFKFEKENVLNALSVEDISEEEILNLAIEGKNIDPKMQEKLECYDSVIAENKVLKDEKVENALKNGVRAMGADNFDNTYWKKLLNTMDLKGINTTSDMWDRTAKANLKAGVSVGEVEKVHETEKTMSNCKENYNV